MIAAATSLHIANTHRQIRFYGQNAAHNTAKADRVHMQRTVALSRDAYFKHGLFPIAARIVDPKTNTVIAESTNTELDPNTPLGGTPIAHAEVSAIVKASKYLKQHGKNSRDLSGTVLYTSHYPCPMCLGTMMMAGIKRFVYGNSLEQTNQFAQYGFNDKTFYQQIALPTEARTMSGTQQLGDKAFQVMKDWQADLESKGIFSFKPRGEG